MRRLRATVPWTVDVVAVVVPAVHHVAGVVAAAAAMGAVSERHLTICVEAYIYMMVMNMQVS